MKHRKTLVVLLGVLALAACSADDEPEPMSQAERDTALRDSAFGGLVEPMDRAQAVQQLQIDRKRELDEAIGN